MERRKQPRFDVVHLVQVTVLDEPPVKLEGHVVNLSGAGFQLLTDGKIRIGAAVRVDLADAMLLGEVCYCRENGSGRYAIGLESQQILSHTSEMSSLMKSLAGDSERERVASLQPGHGILSDE